MNRVIRALACASLAFLSVSCAHQLEIVNLEEYDIPLTDGPPKSVAVVTTRLADAAAEDSADGVTNAEIDQSSRLTQHIVEALRRHPSIDQVRTSWSPQRVEPGFEPDLVIAIRPRAEYEGSGWNFPLTFPGFLLFLPAGHGYVYHGHLTTEIDLLDDTAAKLAQTISVPASFEMRHCDFGRAFFAETGWWLPGYGASSALAAFYMMTYDADATQPFHREVAQVWGDYVAEQLIRAVNGASEGHEVTTVARP